MTHTAMKMQYLEYKIREELQEMKITDNGEIEYIDQTGRKITYQEINKENQTLTKKDVDTAFNELDLSEFNDT